MVQPWGQHVDFTLVTANTQITNFTLSAGNSYVKPSPSSVNLTLESGYTAPSSTLVDLTLAPEHLCPPYIPPAGAAISAQLVEGYTIPMGSTIIVVLDPCGGFTPEPQVIQLYLSVLSPWGRSTERSVRPVQSSYGSVPKVETTLEFEYGHGPSVGPELNSGWNATPRQDLSNRSSWNPGATTTKNIELDWNKVGPLDHLKGLGWEPSSPLHLGSFGLNWNRVYPYDRVVGGSWNRALLPGQYVDPPPYVVETNSDGVILPRGELVNFLLRSSPTGSAAAITLKEEVIIRPKDHRQSLNFVLSGTEDGSPNLVLTGRAAYTPPLQANVSATLKPLYQVPTGGIEVVLGIVGGSTVAVVDPPPYVQQRTDPLSWSMPWSSVPKKDTGLTLPWGSGSWPGRDPIVDGPWNNDPPPPPVPPQVSPPLPVYIVMNNISVVRLPGLEPIQVSSFSISGSEDGTFWLFRGELSNPNQLPLLQKDADGPKEIQVTVNGHVWTFAVEDYDDGREFNQWRVSLTGRSRTVLLADPFAPRRSFYNDSPFSLQQLIARELENTGFTLDYATVDWTVPIGAWYYQDLTPMEAIIKLAEAAGAVVQSDMALKQIRVAPKYPVSPWDWTGAQLDKAVNDDQIRTLGFQNKTLPLYDYVLVSGESQGVSDVIQRTGSGGEVRAPMVVDPLILEHPAALERGRNILSDRGEQGLVTISLQLNPETTAPGLILPLHLVQVQESTPWIGKSTSTEVSVTTADDGTVEVWMTNLLERHYSDAN